MRQSLETSGTDRLTVKELPFLDDDEWVEIRKVRDFLRDQTAEAKSYLRVTESDVAEQDPEDEDAEISEVGTLRRDNGMITLRQFEYMATAWNLYEPADATGHREPIEFTRENREKFIRKFGVYFLVIFFQRGGGFEPIKELEGKVDANGDPLTFSSNGALSASGEVPAESAARSIRAVKAVHDRTAARVQVG